MMSRFWQLEGRQTGITLDPPQKWCVCVCLCVFIYCIRVCVCLCVSVCVHMCLYLCMYRSEGGKLFHWWVHPSSQTLLENIFFFFAQVSVANKLPFCRDGGHLTLLGKKLFVCWNLTQEFCPIRFSCFYFQQETFYTVRIQQIWESIQLACQARLKNLLSPNVWAHPV